jgi:hypothetical protein
MEDQAAQQNEVAGDSAKPGKLLYHYTDQKGLLGILKDKCIWATHAQYLNDTSEGKIVSQAIFDELCSRYNADSLFQSLGMTPDKTTKQNQCVDEEILGKGISIATWVTSQNVFVASFSRQGNLLSQWRAYSGRSGGYSIGFKPSYLNAVGKNFLNGRLDRFNNADALVRCTYYDETDCDEKEMQSLKNEICSLVSSYINNASSIAGTSIVKGTEGFATSSAIALKHFLPLAKRAAIAKNIGFHEEDEWRLALILNQNSIPADLEFRDGGSMLIPYLEIPLCWENQTIDIQEIIVGPRQNPDEAAKSVESVKMLLKREGIHGVDVIDSKIPFRNR